MIITRRYTQSGRSPYEDIPFKMLRSEIRNPDGSLVFALDEVEVPAHWSQVAADVLAQKYFRRAGVPARLGPVMESAVPNWLSRSAPVSDENDRIEYLPFGETSAKQVFHRLAGAWTYWGWQCGYFDSEADARAFYDELVYMLAMQIAAPNSPQWFNTGLHWVYGLEVESRGHYYVDPFDPSGETLVASTTSYEHPQAHACFIQAVADDLLNEGGIMDLWTREARLFKYGSGTGSNFSKLRGEGEPLSSGGHSSGLMSFLKVGDRAAGAVKSGGTTRRAAKMVILDADYPDVEAFVGWKARGERKVAALVAGSKALQRAFQKIAKACADFADKGDARFDPEQNAALKGAIREARRAFAPDALIDQAIALARQGEGELEIEALSTDWDSEAYLTVAGQNSNNTIRVTDAFMQAVEADGDWTLTRRTDGKPHKTLRAGDLWRRIGKAAWASADPGLQFHTTINDWHTCPAGGDITRAANMSSSTTPRAISPR